MSRSYCTPAGKSAAVSTLSSLAPGQVAVPVMEFAQPAEAATTRRASADAIMCRPVMLPRLPAKRAEDGRPLGWTALQQAEDRVDVGVGRQQVGHRVELCVPPRGHVDVVGGDEAVPPPRRGRVGEPLAPDV